LEDLRSDTYPSVAINLPDAEKLSGWAKFAAVMNIIIGALSCFGVITAAYGIPLIISGVKLLAAVDDLKRYTEANDAQKLSDTFANLYKYFKMTGVAYIVMICFWILAIILYGVLIAFFVSYMGSSEFNYNF